MKSSGKLAKPLDSSLGAQYCKCSFSIYLGFKKKFQLSYTETTFMNICVVSCSCPVVTNDSGYYRKTTNSLPEAIYSTFDIK